jgi:hypothetical protein
MVVREQIVTIDEDEHRVVWSAIGKRSRITTRQRRLLRM